MATSVQSSTWQNATDENFRTWGKAISDGIAAVGLVKVADAGTVNWATAVRGATVASWGFEIWRFDDALQATHPVFIKVEYGAGNSSAVGQSVPQLWVTIGKGADGAGGIVDILAPRRTCQPYTALTTPASGNASIEPIMVSSDGSSLCVVPRQSAPGATVLHVPAFVIDRSRDASGTPTAAGGVILTEGSGAVSTVSQATSGEPAQMHVWTYAGDSTMGNVPAVVPATVNGSTVTVTTSLAVGDRAPVFPYIATPPNHEPWQVLAAVAVMAGDAANGAFTANVMGKLRNYRSIPVGDAHNRWMTGVGAPGYTGLCILWEAD